jgi:hypothetical protein
VLSVPLPLFDGPRQACHLPVRVKVDALSLLLKPDIESMLLRCPGAVRTPELDKCSVSAKLRYVDARLWVTVAENCETTATAARSASPAEAVTPFLSVALKPALRLMPTNDLQQKK